MRNVNVNLVQFKSEIGDIEANYNKAVSYIEKASKDSSDLVVFPELFLTGYDLNKLNTKYSDLAQSFNSEIITDFCKTARKYNINLVLPIGMESVDIPGVIYNSALAINREGKILGVYHKTHLWSGEREFFKPGIEYPIFEFDFGKVAIMICYDGGFPEVSRIYALKGAELILCPSAFPIRDKDMWDIYFVSRALENSCFVGATNNVYHENGHQLFGNNKMIDPLGKVLLNGSENKEEMQSIQINLDDVKNTRKNVPYLRDRQVHTYNRLV
ncbi:MAG: nitrilase-related carbon-nitrogen hydrolase [Bacillota bacterium]